MSDEGIRAREKAEKQMELRLLKTYTEAQKDILKKLDGFVSQHKAKDKFMRKRRDDGEISEDDYKDWLSRQVFIGAQWEEKVREITNRLTEIRGDDLKMIHDRQIGVFADNANYQAYKLEHDIGKNFGFDLYDEDAVRNLIEKKPALLPEKIVDPKKHNHWNQGIISNCITQGIIQGESIPKIAKRIANTTANQNLKASTMYARTAMTCAQNSGRMQMLRQSKEMGINVKKQWMSTHDARTRDSHIRLDRQIEEVEKPFKSMWGKIEYPGDPKAHPADVYNCRCTLVYVYPEYDDLSEFEDYPEAKNMTFEQWQDARREAADRIINDTDMKRRENELIALRELAQEYGIDGDVEDQLVSARLANAIIEKSIYKLPNSKWTGLVKPFVGDDMFDGQYAIDTHDLHLRKDSWFETSIHELLHSRSKGLTYESYDKYGNIEEACVETLTRAISSRLSVFHTTKYNTNVEVLRLTANYIGMNPGDLAAELLDVSLSKRYTFLVNAVDKIEKTGEIPQFEIDMLRNSMKIFEGV